jgi:hypothetical protein
MWWKCKPHKIEIRGGELAGAIILQNSLGRASYISRLTTTSSPARADIRQDYGSLLSMHKTESKTVEY